MPWSCCSRSEAFISNMFQNIMCGARLHLFLWAPGMALVLHLDCNLKRAPQGLQSRQQRLGTIQPIQQEGRAGKQRRRACQQAHCVHGA